MSHTLKEAVICEPIRTPVGKYGGVFRDIPTAQLAETVVRELIRRTKIDPTCIDDVIFGQCYPNGEAPAIGRIAALVTNAGRDLFEVEVGERLVLVPAVLAWLIEADIPGRRISMRLPEGLLDE